MIINFVLSFFIVYYTGLVRISFINLLLIIMLASIEALIITLFMGAFGDNRVDGLALTKALGVLFVVPIIDRAVNFKLNFLLGIIPTYWVPKALEQQQLTLTFLFIIIIGIIVHLLYAFIIYKRFERKI
jgi:fluoroquinolone transport system permease protein